MRSKRQLHFLEKYSDTHIGNLFDTFLKFLYLINYPFIYPCFASFSLLVEVNLWVLKGYPPSIATQCYDRLHTINKALMLASRHQTSSCTKGTLEYGRANKLIVVLMTQLILDFCVFSLCKLHTLSHMLGYTCFQLENNMQSNVVGYCYPIAMLSLTRNKFNLVTNYVKHATQSSHMFELCLGAQSHVLTYLSCDFLGYSGIVTHVDYQF